MAMDCQSRNSELNSSLEVNKMKTLYSKFRNDRGSYQ